MDQHLRKVVEAEFFSSFEDLCERSSLAVYRKKKIRRPGVSLIEVSRCNWRRVYIGILFQSLDRFEVILAWSPLELPLRVSFWPIFGTAEEKYARGDASDVLAEKFGYFDLLKHFVNSFGVYDLSLHFAQKKNSEEYRIWFRRTTKHPTWQEIIAPRAASYAKEAACIAVDFGMPLARQLCREFDAARHLPS